MNTQNEIAVQHTLAGLPGRSELSKNFCSVPMDEINEMIQENIIANLILESDAKKNGKERFKNVLLELDRLKIQLGGSRYFCGKTPTIEDTDSSRTLFGFPIAAVKDWLRMTLKNDWSPRVFWVELSALFGVTLNGMSQYEEAHTRIQRFGMLIENKERFIHILESKDDSRYDELSKITGLGWHPTRNGFGTEKMYIEFIEKYLTDYFEDAKSKGDDALIDYFYAFEGVCFEDRARNLEAYAISHPLASETSEEITAVADWSTSDKVEDVFMKETTILALKNNGTPPTPTVLLEHLQKKGVFDMEFLVSQGDKSKPTEEKFRKWAQDQIDMCILSEEEPMAHMKLG